MKYTYFFIFLASILISACKSNNETVNNDDDSKDNISTDTLSETSNVIDTNQTIIYDNDSLTISTINDTLSFKKGSVEILKTYMQPLLMIGGVESNPREKWDEAFIIANCLVILRTVISEGHFCHTPSVNNVEIYADIDSSYQLLLTAESDSTFFYTDFQGNRFSNPNGDWGVITNEAEGELYGFMIIQSNGKITTVSFKDEEFFEGITYEAHFNEKDQLIWSSYEGGSELIVNKDGTYFMHLAEE